MNHRNALSILTAIGALACASAARADDKIVIAPQGNTTYVTYYTTQSMAAPLEMGEAGAGSLVQMTGVTRNTAGHAAFDNLSVRCVGYHETMGGKLQTRGSCVEIDAEGDKVFTTYAAGVHTVVGGTGKYKGITGSAPFTVVSRLPSTAAGLGAIAVEHKQSWQIK